jgi:hypothetical protein
MVTALTTPAIKYRLALRSENESDHGVRSGSYQVVNEAGDRSLCQKRETAERLVELLGDDVSCFSKIFTTALQAGSLPDDESLRTF